MAGGSSTPPARWLIALILLAVAVGIGAGYLVFTSLT
jgi:hypothetical protein